MKRLWKKLAHFYRMLHLIAVCALRGGNRTFRVYFDDEIPEETDRTRKLEEITQNRTDFIVQFEGEFLTSYRVTENTNTMQNGRVQALYRTDGGVFWLVDHTQIFHESTGEWTNNATLHRITAEDLESGGTWQTIGDLWKATLEANK